MSITQGRRLSDVDFRFSLVYQDSKSVVNQSQYRNMTECKVLYINQGSCRATVDSVAADLTQGDLLIAPNGSLCRLTGGDMSATVISALMFDRESVLSESAVGLSSMIAQSVITVSLDALNRTAVEGRLAAIYDEYLRRRPGYRERMLAEVQSLLAQVSRDVAESSDAKDHPSQPRWIRQVCQYIDDHLDASISICELADSVWISPSHLSRMFKRHVGSSITEYIMARRIQLAKQLLGQTDEVVAAIAVACGYESLPHFYRSFKRCTGLTPSKFRHRNRYFSI